MDSLAQGLRNIGQRLWSEKAFASAMIMLGAVFIAIGLYRFRVRPEHFGLLDFLGALWGLLERSFCYWSPTTSCITRAWFLSPGSFS